MVEEHRTHPQRIRDALAAEPKPQSVRELSQAARLSEREVEYALQKISKGQSLLRIAPPSCVACEYSFRDWARVSRPSRCPRCRSERIQPPRFTLG